MIRKNLLALSFTLFLLLQSADYLPALADDDDEPESTQIEWTERFSRVVEIATEPLNNYLKSSKNGFDSLALARVSSRAAADEKGREKYQVLWYKNGEPVGVRGVGKLAFAAPQKVALHITHKNLPAAESEVKASANAALRMFLDLNAKSISPIAIIVPRSSFNSFVHRLNQLNFYSADEPQPDTPVFTSIVLSVESEPPGITQLLFYSGSQ